MWTFCVSILLMTYVVYVSGSLQLIYVAGDPEQPENRTVSINIGNWDNNGKVMDSRLLFYTDAVTERLHFDCTNQLVYYTWCSQSGDFKDCTLRKIGVNGANDQVYMPASHDGGQVDLLSVPPVLDWQLQHVYYVFRYGPAEQYMYEIHRSPMNNASKHEVIVPYSNNTFIVALQFHSTAQILFWATRGEKDVIYSRGTDGVIKEFMSGNDALAHGIFINYPTSEVCWLSSNGEDTSNITTRCADVVGKNLRTHVSVKREDMPTDVSSNTILLLSHFTDRNILTLHRSTFGSTELPVPVEVPGKLLGPAIFAAKDCKAYTGTSNSGTCSALTASILIAAIITYLAGYREY